MNPKVLVCALLTVVGACASTPIPVWADDSAASIAAGGLVPRRETRIVMAKEVLRISPTKIVVDYDFRNDSDQNVTTEVAFPIPPYGYGPESPEISSASFSDFKLLVDGKPVKYQTEAKATLNGKDVTGILTSDGIDIASFGHLRDFGATDSRVHTPDVERLPKAEQQRLARLGLFDADDGWGTWDAHLQYHWTQTFPAHSTVHIRHEYTPVEGFEMMPLETFRNFLQHTQPGGNDESVRYQREDLQLLRRFCPDPSLLRASIRAIENTDPENGPYAYPHWVDFILTSANTWKQPIEDFTLIVERGKPDAGNSRTFVSFCSPQNAPVGKLDADHFQVHLTNFVPASELHIGFFDLPEVAPAQKK
ncbi:MAG: DUF4424 family protein [Terracidiphilus sp.]